jgi:hypothetical protein
MLDNTIVKYINNEPIHKNAIMKDLKERDNGCVQGPNCLECIWSHGPQGCPNGVYCAKPEHSPCPPGY